MPITPILNIPTPITVIPLLQIANQEAWTVVNGPDVPNAGQLVLDNRSRLITKSTRALAVRAVKDCFVVAVIPGEEIDSTSQANGFRTYQLVNNEVNLLPFRCRQIEGIAFARSRWFATNTAYTQMRFEAPVPVDYLPTLPNVSYPPWNADQATRDAYYQYSSQTRAQTLYYKKLIRSCTGTITQYVEALISQNIIRVVQFRDL